MVRHGAILFDVRFGIALVTPAADGGVGGFGDDSGSRGSALGKIFGQVGATCQRINAGTVEFELGSRFHADFDAVDGLGHFQQRDLRGFLTVDQNTDHAAVVALGIKRQCQCAVIGQGRGQQILRVCPAFVFSRAQVGCGAQGRFDRFFFFGARRVYREIQIFQRNGGACRRSESQSTGQRHK